MIWFTPSYQAIVDDKRKRRAEALSVALAFSTDAHGHYVRATGKCYFNETRAVSLELKPIVSF